jgi:hypothetical protein
MSTALMPNGRNKYFDSNGRTLAFGLVYTYAAGTSTPKAAYTDSAGLVPHTNPIQLDAKGEATIYWNGAYKVDVKSAYGISITGFPLDNFVSTNSYADGILSTFVTSLLSSAGAALVGWIQSGAGAIYRYIRDKLRESVSVSDFGSNQAALVAALTSSATEVLIPRGVVITLTSTLTVPDGKKIRFQGGTSVAGTPDSYFLKSASLNGTAVVLGANSEFQGGGIVAEAGNGGDGFQLLGNSSKLIKSFSIGNDGDGVRIGSKSTSSGNSNSFLVEEVFSQNNGGRGFYVHHSTTAEGPDANAGVLRKCFATGNASDGIKLGHCFWVTVENCLTEVNGGWGLDISSTVNGGAAESRYHTIIGGDFNEGNTAGTGRIDGYACSVYHPDQNQLFTISGTFCNWFGSSISTIQSIDLLRGFVKFPAVQNPIDDRYAFDDYREINAATSFLPVVAGSPTAGTATYSKQAGRITKLGRLVQCEVEVVWTGGTGAGILRVGNLPYSCNSELNVPVTIGQINVPLTAGYVATAYVDIASNYITISQYPVGGGAPANVPYSAAGTLVLNFSYSIDG